MVGTMLDWDALQPERPRPLRRDEFERLVDAGVFADERVELLRGVLVTMSPQGEPHVWISSELAEQLVLQLERLGLRDRFQVRSHGSFAATEDSEPEPDIAVVPRRPFGGPLADRALLLIEVSDSSLQKDRRIKTSIYAEAGVPEYWIVDVDGGAVEVHTDPNGSQYRTMVRLGRGDVLRPVELPGVAIEIAAILPAA